MLPATSTTSACIPCTDSFNRVRSVGLWPAPTGGKVVLVAPPAEVALLTPAQARELRDRLDELADEVEAKEFQGTAGCLVPDIPPV
jgi:hypothetical protein